MLNVEETPVAENDTGLPLIPAPAAVPESVLAPACTVQLPTVATPKVFVVVDTPVTLPPPPVTAKVTATPETGPFAESSTCRAGWTLSAYPMRPVWPSPEATIACVGVPPARAVAVKVCGLPVTPPSDTL